MTIRTLVQDALKEAMKNKDTFRLECLRMAKGALLLKEKESSSEITEEQAMAALRAEVRKRQQSIEIFRQHGKEEEAQETEREISVFNEFLPQQLSEEELENRVRAYLAAHPEMNHPGKLTGAIKKELGEQADGKALNAICQRVLGA